MTFHILCFINTGNKFFKPIGYDIYAIMVLKKSPYYLCIQKDKLSPNDNSFQDSNFDDLYVIGIPYLLMNIMYCHVFAQELNTNVIFMCHIN